MCDSFLVILEFDKPKSFMDEDLIEPTNIVVKYGYFKRVANFYRVESQSIRELLNKRTCVFLLEPPALDFVESDDFNRVLKIMKAHLKFIAPITPKEFNECEFLHDAFEAVQGVNCAYIRLFLDNEHEVSFPDEPDFLDDKEVQDEILEDADVMFMHEGGYANELPSVLDRAIRGII